MPFQDDRRRPRGRILLLIVAFLITVLSFGGPLAAYAAPTPSASDTATPDGGKADKEKADKDKAAEDATPTSDSSTSEKPATDDSASPSEEPSKTPDADDPTSTDPDPSESDTEPTTKPTDPASSTPTPGKETTPGKVVAKVVPPATGNNAVITVKVGGNRTSLTAVGNLAGVQLGFFAAETGGTALFTCTSDADGDCSITVPNTQIGGANRNARYWVRQTGTAGGYYTNPSLGTGTTVAADSYTFRTGSDLQSGTIYRSTADFMIGTGNTNNEASGGIWQSSLNNPTFPAKCGVNVALVLDLSSSVTDAQLTQLKNAANSFVDSLTGTPSQVGTFTFATGAPASAGDTLALTSVSSPASAATVKSKISSYNKPGGNAGGTNWDRGLYQVAQSSSSFDVAVVITDGNPTFYAAGEGPGNRTRFREVENGIFSANAIKAKNTKVLAVGVGDGIGNSGSGQNLRSISGPTLNTDYYQTNDYAAAGAALRALALGNCEGSITVVKEVVPADAPANSIAGAVPQGGWTFTGTGSTGITFNSPAARATANGTGAVNFPLTFSGGTTTGPVTLNETQQADYTLQTISGSNATCRRVDTGATITATNSGATGFTVTAASAYPVSCIVYNKPPKPLASVVLHKTWVVNGVTYADGEQPGTIIATGTLNGTSRPWNQEQTGFRQNDLVSIDESTDLSGVPLCALSSARLTSQNGTTVNLGLPSPQTLAAGLNNYTITNTVTCDTKLKLTKTVQGGTAAAADWTLTAATPAGAVPGPSGTTGVNKSVSPAVTYPLTENSAHPEYAQFVDPNAVLIAGSSGSWNCQEVRADGITVIPGYSDGLNGGVTVPFGRYVSCNAVNRTSTLILRKVVQNAHGGTAVPANWNLTATPTGTVPPGLPAQTVTGSMVGAALNVRPGVTYAITESAGPAGYSLDSITCDTLPGDPRVATVTLNPLDTTTCTFTNVDTPATLTLQKTVTNDNGGTAAATAWTLSAAGTTPISGASGSTAVTSAVVSAGTYALSESGGPAGYAAGAWSCTGGALTGSSVVVSNGANVTCTINNNDIGPHLTLVKTVTNDNGGTAVVTAWTLAAAGPTPISGTTGATSVTNAAVNAGTYTLSETGPAGYTAGAWSCTAGTLTGSGLVLPLNTSATCTINNNDQPATLTLRKTVTKNNGGTALPTAWTLAAAGPTPISGATGATSVTDAPVNAGTYTLSESGGPGGYTAGAWACTAGSLSGASLVLGIGVSATCTINNADQPAHLTLRKTVTNDNGGTAVETAWTLAAAGATPISGVTGTAAVTRAPINSGSYTLSESGGPVGYAPGAWSCTGGAAPPIGATVIVPTGGNVICTINNDDQPATLTLVKVVDQANTGATATPGQWTLTAAGPTQTVTGPGNSAQVTGQSVPAGMYALSESGGVSGYTAGNWSCVGGTLTGTNVVVPNGGSVTCTIINTAQQPRLTLVKTVINGTTGGTAEPANWTLTAETQGGGIITGPGNSGAVTNQAVNVGTWNLSESGGPAGYTPGTWSCTGAALAGTAVTIIPGSNATCRIANTAQQAHLTLIKTVTNNNGGTALDTAWTLDATGGPTSGISGSTGSTAVTNVPVSPGSYALAESGGPAGYAAGNWSCIGTGTLTGSSIALALGQTATCTINNDDQSAHLTLVKTVTNDNGGTAAETEWTLAAGGPTPISGASGSGPVTNAPVNAGTYTLSEANGPAGYTAGAWSCTGGTLTGASLVLPLNTSATCTINNDDQPATLTLVKTVTNNNGGTALPTAWTLGAAGPTPISGATGTGPVTGAIVSAGTYALSESGGRAGYTAGDWSCTAGTLTGSNLVLPNGVSSTCTIDNDDQPASLTLVKVVDNGTTGATFGPGDWDLTAQGPTPVSGAGGSPAIENQTVSAGTYTLSEANGPVGYRASAWTCDGATVTGATVVVPNGGDVTCTITNTVVQPTLTLVKVVNNGDSGDDAQPSEWTLSAAGPTTVTGPGNSAAVTGQPVQVADYNLSEAGGPAGYTAGDWSCVGATDSSETAVTIGAGDDVTCTITNSTVAPSLTLIKVVDNGDTGATAAATDWTLTATGPTPVSGPTGVSQPVQIGTYDLAESGGPAGYRASAWVCSGATDSTTTSVTVGLNDVATCTITNTAQQPTLTLVKEVINDDGGSAVPSDWTLTADGPTPLTGVVGDATVTNAPVAIGAYTLDENALLTGYTAGDWSCVGGSLSGSTVTIAVGDNVTCTIVNDDQPAQLTLVKNVINPQGTGGTAVDTDWTLSADGATPISGATGDDSITDATVDADDYTLAEEGPDGYAAGNWTCGDGTQIVGNVVTVPNGGDITCTITNTAQQAYLTLVKTVTNDNGGTAVPTDWTLRADGPTQGVIGRVGDTEVTDAPIQTGDYLLAETNGPSGYIPGGWTCVGGSLSGSTVTIGLGDDVTCTIDNDDQPATLTLVKTVDHSDTGDATPDTAWNLSAAGPSPISGATGSDDVTGATVDAGMYDLSESGPAGFTPSDWDCGDAIISDATVTVPNGGDVTCTITNTAIMPTLTLVKIVDNGDTGATHSADEWALTAEGPTQLITVTTGVTTPAQVGTYDLSETGPDGYDMSEWVCTGAGASSAETVTLDLDQNATCTITNTAQQPTLTLFKQVVNDDGGTAEPTEWTLTADGPTTGITGPVDDPAVTAVPVEIGAYELSEANGPTGYAAGDWSCTGGSLSGSTVTVALGDAVTCTIVNDDILGTWNLAKASEPASGATVQPGDLITYTVTATKTGGVNPVDRVVNDDLSNVLNNATLVGDPVASTGTASISGTTLTWDIPSLGGTETVTYRVQVNADAYGVRIGNVVTGEGSDTCPPDDPGDECTTTHVTPHYTLTKASDPATGSTVLPGDTISYTLTVDNDSDGVLNGAVVTDNLADVLDNARLGEVGDGGSVTGTTLTWTVPTVRPGDSATLTYEVTINDDQWGVTLRNVATPGPGGDCTEPDDCTTQNFTPRWLLAKSSDPASGSTVTPGSSVTYTLTVRNVSEAVVTGAVATDDLADVLDNASLDAVPDGATVSGTTLSWALPTLQPGDLATLSYTVTIDDDAVNQTLHNVATPGGGGECVPAADLEDLRQASAMAAVDVSALADPEVCTTTHYTPEWTLSKMSDPASGSTVRPGETVSYTLTATNVSNAVVSGGVATDDLSAVLAHATVNDPLPTDTELSGSTLTWQVPTLDPGDSATLTYSVTLDDDAWDTSITNVVTPDSDGRCVASCTTNHTTPPEPHEPNLPNTGGPALAVVGVGLELLLGGGGLLLWTRRRRTE